MLLLAFSSPFLLPTALAPRLRVLALLSLLSPWLVIGREAGRRARGLRRPLAGAVRLPWLVLLELLMPLALIFVMAALNAPLRAALSLTAFNAALLSFADALDRAEGRGGEAWAKIALWSGLLFTAPLWLAPFYGLASLAPWVASCGVGLHPLASALAGAGRVTLQDPYFYQWTLSGVLEVRPLSWAWGAGLYALAAALGARLAVRAART